MRIRQHPDGVKVYETASGGFTISQWDQWLPGIFDSEVTAVQAATLTYDQLAGLASIYQVDGENRPVTMADLPYDEDPDRV